MLCQRHASAHMASSDCFAFFYFKRYVFERPEFAEVLLGRQPSQALQAGGDKLLEPITRGVVKVVGLAEVADTDGDIGYGCEPLS
jgi:hypothetical protein